MQIQENKSTQHFTFVSKVKPGRGPNIRAKAAERANMPWEDIDKLLRPLTLHYARWILFDNDTRFIYYASFDTDLDKYIDDAARIFAESGVAGFFPDLPLFEMRVRYLNVREPFKLVICVQAIFFLS